MKAFNSIIGLILAWIYIIFSHKIILLILYLFSGLFLIIVRKNKKQYWTMIRNIVTNCAYFRHNFYKLPSHHTIFLVNYPITIMEYSAPVLLPKKICFLTSKRAKKFMDLVYEEEDYLLFDDSKGKNYELLRDNIREKIKDRSIYVYVEDIKSRYYDYDIGRMRKGMFHIAKEIGVTITPLAVDSLKLNKKFEIRVGETQLVINPVESMKRVRSFLFDSKQDFRATKASKMSSVQVYPEYTR